MLALRIWGVYESNGSLDDQGFREVMPSQHTTLKVFNNPMNYEQSNIAVISDADTIELQRTDSKVFKLNEVSFAEEKTETQKNIVVPHGKGHG